MDSVYIEYGNQYEYNGTNIEIALGGLCLNCKHQSYKNDKNFIKTNICIVKFWKDRRYKLLPNKPVLKCLDFEPCT